MKKAILMLALLITLCSIDVQAETISGEKGWQVEFKGNSMDSNFTNADVSETIYALQPGDTASFHIDLYNHSKVETDWYLTNEVMKSLEDSQSVAEGGAYKYVLKYTDPKKKETLLYDSSNVGGESSSDREGLHEATQSLEDWMFLGTISPGKKGSIDLEVGLDGETQGNAYQDTLAKLRINFAVEKNLSADKSTGNTGDTSDHTLKEVIKTGDDNGFFFWSLAMVLSGLVLLLLLHMSKSKKRNLAGLGMFLLLFLMTFSSVDAKEPYTYSVRIYAGNQGSFTGSGIQAPMKASVNYTKGCITVSNLDFGDVVVFDAAAPGKVSLSETSRYYVKGIREAGRDNNTVDGTAIVIDGDKRYVAAYGLKGEMVKYTVRYVDAESGKELAPDREYEGKPSDKPVAAYLYIDGYRPNAYNITKTLSADSSKNIFTFEYTKIEADESGDETESVQEQAGQGTDLDGTSGAEENAGNDGEGAGNVTGGEADLIPQEEMRSVDEDEVPLALIDLDDEASVLFSYLSSNPVKSVTIVACTAILLFLIVIYLKKKKEE